MIDWLVQHETLNFFVTNRIPRRLATRFMGWFSRLEHPWLCRLSLAIWQRFGGSLNLHEARQTTFASIHDCFIRELKPGARPIDAAPGVLISPCDAIVGACGRLTGTELLQAKGFTYTLEELLTDRARAEAHRDGTFVTLRLTSTMYHRFHAPDDCAVDQVIHVPGDVWNVNPAAVKRVPRLYCRNERAILCARLRDTDAPITLVPIAAILVGSLHLGFLDLTVARADTRTRRLACRAAFARGDELGYFHHGSTIVILTGSGFRLASQVVEGATVRMGQVLLQRETPGTA